MTKLKVFGCDCSYENASPKARPAYSIHVIETDGTSYAETNWSVKTFRLLYCKNRCMALINLF